MSGPPQDAIQTFIHIAQNFPTQVMLNKNVFHYLKYNFHVNLF